MKAAFFHDTPLYLGENNKYYSIDMPKEIWSKYLKVFRKLIVVTRYRNKADLTPKISKGLKESSTDKVEFYPVEGYRTPNQIINIKKHVKVHLQNVDCAIIRLPSVIGFIAFHEAKKLGIPVAVESVGCPWDALWNYGTLKAKLLAIPMFIFNKHYISNSSHVIYVTEEFLQNRYPSKGLMYGCSDVAIGNPDETVLLNRLEKIKSGLNDRPIIFGLIGSLNVNYKGHELALRALATLKHDLNFRLRFLGGGNERKWRELSQNLGIDDKVEFSGVLPTGQPVFDWMDDLDIFLIPSLQEGLPRSLVEAMSRGLPAIGSTAGGIGELLSGEFQHKPDSFKQLEKLIHDMTIDSKCMLDQARINFEKSKGYSDELLKEKQSEFWREFYEYSSKNSD